MPNKSSAGSPVEPTAGANAPLRPKSLPAIEPKPCQLYCNKVLEIRSLHYSRILNSDTGQRPMVSEQHRLRNETIIIVQPTLPLFAGVKLGPLGSPIS